MAFHTLEFDHLARFNSATSSDLLDKYENYVDNMLVEESKEPSSRTFAPSAFRCDRRSWFRLRGVYPDEVKVPDRVLDFSAKIGTACHEMIQNNLKNMLGDDWVDVSEYISSYNENRSFEQSEVSCVTEGFETKVEIKDPPVRFACDGILRFNDKLYLLEIKSSEYASWNDLTDPKPQHIDQVKCYCTLLHLSDVIFIYIDRQYGGLKCFEVSFSSREKEDILERFHHVQRMVEYNLAPDPLPKGDSWCNPSMCPYYKKCGEYGR